MTIYVLLYVDDEYYHEQFRGMFLSLDAMYAHCKNTYPYFKSDSTLIELDKMGFSHGLCYEVWSTDGNEIFEI